MQIKKFIDAIAEVGGDLVTLETLIEGSKIVYSSVVVVDRRCPVCSILCCSLRCSLENPLLL